MSARINQASAQDSAGVLAQVPVFFGTLFIVVSIDMVLSAVALTHWVLFCERRDISRINSVNSTAVTSSVFAGGYENAATAIQG